MDRSITINCTRPSTPSRRNTAVTCFFTVPSLQPRSSAIRRLSQPNTMARATSCCRAVDLPVISGGSAISSSRSHTLRGRAAPHARRAHHVKSARERSDQQLQDPAFRLGERPTPGPVQGDATVPAACQLGGLVAADLVDAASGEWCPSSSRGPPGALLTRPTERGTLGLMASDAPIALDRAPPQRTLHRAPGLGWTAAILAWVALRLALRVRRPPQSSAAGVLP